MIKKIKKAKKCWVNLIRGYRLIYHAQKSILPVLIVKSICKSILPFLPIYYSSQILNGIYLQLDSEKISRYIIELAISSLIIGLLTFYFEQKWCVLGEECFNNIRLQLSFKTFELDLAHIENPKTRDKLRQIFDNLDDWGFYPLFEIITGLVVNITTIISSIFMCADFWVSDNYISTEDSFLKIFCSKSAIIIIATLVLVVSILNSYVKYKNEQKIFKINQELPIKNKLWNFYEDEYIRDNKIGKDIRIYNQKFFILSELNKALDNISKTNKLLIKCKYKQQSFSNITLQILSGVFYLFVVFRIWTNKLQIGSLIKDVVSINKLVSSICEIASIIPQIVQNNEYLEAIYEFLDMKSQLSFGENHIPQKDNLVFEFHNVSFKYPGSNVYAIKNISLRISSSDKIAIVGCNGSGKSTFIKLLNRLYDPTEGFISLNGVDIKNIHYQEYLKLFSTVFQDYKLFPYSVCENISTTLHYDENRILKSLNQLNFDNYILSLDKGLKTVVYKDFDENGIEFSGGESQKLAISRSLYRSGEILILDEPTSAFDPISESELYQKLQSISDKKIIVYVSHRLSSCKMCNKILVFDSGSVIQNGSHNELIKTNGHYKTLWEAQAQHYIKR